VKFLNNKYKLERWVRIFQKPQGFNQEKPAQIAFQNPQRPHGLEGFH
jgi:hypothetical protein